MHDPLNNGNGGVEFVRPRTEEYFVLRVILPAETRQVFVGLTLQALRTASGC